MTTGTVDNQIKITRNAESRGNLQSRSGIRNVSHRTFDFRLLAADDDEGRLQYPSARSNTFFGHSAINPMPELAPYL